MKKYIFGSLLLGAGMLASCSLEENPESAFSEEEAMKSETLIYLNTVAGVYNSLGNTLNTTVIDASNFVSDEFIIQARLGDWFDGGIPMNKFTHNILPSYGSQGGWSNLYGTIARANSAIDKLKTMNSAAANGWIAELRAYRAMLYYNLMDIYGNVPVVTSSTQSTADTAPSTRAEVFKFVLNELNEVLPSLKTDMSQKSGEYYGRMTQPVAYMVLAKMAINAPIFQLDPTQPNWSKDYMGDDFSGEEKVSEAIGANITAKMKDFKMTIDGKERNALASTIYCVEKLEELGYKLSGSYQENFAVANETSNENILTIPNDDKTWKRGWDHERRSWHYNHAGHPVYKGFSAWNGPAATKELVLKYGYTEDRMDPSQCDPRLALNFYLDRNYTEETGEKVTDGYNNEASDLNTELALEYMPLWVFVDMSTSADDIKALGKKTKEYASLDPEKFFQHVVKSAGARFRKYPFDFSTSDASYPGNDLVVFRYADALLLKAEANYRLGNPGLALDDVNKTRARVGLPALSEVSLQVIADERQKELAWEGTRRQDMIRYAILNLPTVDRYEGVHTNGAASKYVKLDGHTYVWPIPQDQIDLNGQLKQAWGY